LGQFIWELPEQTDESELIILPGNAGIAALAESTVLLKSKSHHQVRQVFNFFLATWALLGALGVKELGFKKPCGGEIAQSMTTICCLTIPS
jgi:hypothetical protein